MVELTEKQSGVKVNYSDTCPFFHRLQKQVLLTRKTEKRNKKPKQKETINNFISHKKITFIDEVLRIIGDFDTNNNNKTKIKRKRITI